MNKEAAAAHLDGSIVKLYDARGIQFRTLNGVGATAVSVSGEAIAIRMKNGYTKLFDLTGRYIRTVQ
jgi:hypothetical protein